MAEEFSRSIKNISGVSSHINFKSAQASDIRFRMGAETVIIHSTCDTLYVMVRDTCLRVEKNNFLLIDPFTPFSVISNPEEPAQKYDLLSFRATTDPWDKSSCFFFANGNVVIGEDHPSYERFSQAFANISGTVSKFPKDSQKPPFHALLALHGYTELLASVMASELGWHEIPSPVFEAWDIAFKYRNPVLILTDGAIGQCMEKCYTRDYVPRWTEEERRAKAPWATWGKPATRQHNIITSLELDSARQEVFNEKLQKKYREMEEHEVRFEALNCDDAEYIFVAYGTSARIAMKSMELARAKGLKVGLLRLITLFPFPKKEIAKLAKQVKGMLCVEMSAGQMIEDVKLAAECRIPIEHYGRFGGIIPTPEEVLEAMEQKIIK